MHLISHQFINKSISNFNKGLRIITVVHQNGITFPIGLIKTPSSFLYLQTKNNMVHLKVIIVTALVVTASSNTFRPSPSTAASAISTFYKNNRFKGAFLTCSVKACTADAVAQYIAAGKQRREDEDMAKKDNALSKLNPLRKTRGGDLALSAKKKFSFDLRRSLAFLLYGGFYQGCANEFIYNNILPLLGTGTDWKTVARKVVLELGFVSPLVCIPMAYLVKGLLIGRTISASYANYWDDVKTKGVVFKNWMIFIPVQSLTFSVIPPHLRVSFVAVVSFFWMIILSCILGS
mmetsp:Transcript_9442/g.23075  ORF Transcript_9442/g.23075 Transcript_9442/m.23075 type:complete len:291 (+) Transcript_9442:206-1078(+)